MKSSLKIGFGFCFQASTPTPQEQHELFRVVFPSCPPLWNHGSVRGAKKSILQSNRTSEIYIHTETHIHSSTHTQTQLCYGGLSHMTVDPTIFCLKAGGSVELVDYTQCKLKTQPFYCPRKDCGCRTPSTESKFTIPLPFCCFEPSTY